MVCAVLFSVILRRIFVQLLRGRVDATLTQLEQLFMGDACHGV
jgi:hypothetical protein